MEMLYPILKYMCYGLVTMFSTVLGSFTGMGGAILVKPIFDIIGHFPTRIINEMTTITIFCTTFVGISRHIIRKTPIEYKIIVPIAFGASIGGALGQICFDILIRNVPDPLVIVIQNFGLCVVIIFSYIFIRDREHIEFLELRSPRISFEFGCVLGLISCFLGIGGGPLNVAFLLYLFNYPMKMAIVGSTMIMLFSQTSKLITIAISEDNFSLLFVPNANNVLPIYITIAMAIGAIIGGIIGGNLNKKTENEHTVAHWFNIVQAMVLSTAIYNIVVNLI